MIVPLYLKETGTKKLGSYFLKATISTEQSPYNTPHYNMDLDITWSFCGSKAFYHEFYKGIIEK